MINKSPIYNLQAVLKETNLKADVLRAWERRYGLPNPQRSAGGHRLYSDYDVAVIKWLRARQGEGLSISRAVELWNEISGTGRDPLFEESPMAVLEQEGGQPDPYRIHIFRNKWMDACLRFDSLTAEDLINQAFGLFPIETVCFEILQKGISEIGHLWYGGKASVQQEHFATAMAMRRIETVISVTPRPTREQIVLIGCPEGEWHSFPMLLLTLLLRRRGWNVIFLGANIPLAQMEQTAAVIQPSVILLSAQHLSAAAAIRSAAIVFQKSEIPLGYGGLIFNRIPALREKTPAFFLGETLEGSVPRIEQLLAAQEPYPNIIQLERNFSETAGLFRSYLPLVEATLIELLKKEGFTFEYMSEVNSFVSAGISAAIEMGDARFLEPDLEWVEKLMRDRNLPAGLLRTYLHLYRQAVDSALGAAGMVITDWLSAYLDEN